MSKIIGQDKLIKEVNRIFQVFVNSNCKIRPHFILTGESGSGKSFTIKQLCDMNELNFLEVNAAQITKEGISGNSLSKILSPLVNYSHTPIVVFVDEFDKLFINENTNSQLANESTASVQNEFLKLLESATRARLYKKELHRHACKTGFPTDVNLGFCCHDFSMRGMAGMEAAIISGMAHMTSFVGSETIPAIAALEEYYGANSDEELIAATVPATEHSVMCAGGEEDELGTFKRLINDLYPSGFVSIVSDTWDFWNVIENFLPKLKKDIMARDGRVVIRPDSGDPVDIICGLRTNPHFNTRMKEGKYYCCYAPFNDDAEYVEVSEGQYYGAYYMLGKIFGWNTTSKDYRYPSTKVGLLYGDSITLERQKQIYLRLENAHMAACNLVLGVGSYSYQYASRDSLGFAIKATACVVNGELKEIFKHPKTDDGTKNSLKGLIAVYKGLDGKYTATDQVSIEEEKEGCLETVFEDGILKKEYSLEEIRQRIDHGL